MSQYAERYNALPHDQRALLNALRIEDEIRLVEREKKRMLAEYRKAIRAHNDRIKLMRRNLERQQ